VVVIWQQAHQSNDPAQAAANACTFSSTQTGPVVAAPAAYKPETNATQLIISDLSTGNGKTVKSGDCITAKYYGTLTNGTVFDQDYDSPTALQFQLGVGEVIPGWDQGLIGMKVGGERRLIIPPSLGYGSKAQGPIPANSTLVFAVKLLSIK